MHHVDKYFYTCKIWVCSFIFMGMLMNATSAQTSNSPINSLQMAEDSLYFRTLEVRDWLQNSLNTNSSDSIQILFLLGRTNSRLEDYKAAQVFYQRGLDNCGDISLKITLLQYSAQSFLEEGLLSEAIEPALKALQLAKDSLPEMEAEVYIRLAQIHKGLKNREKQDEYLSKAEKTLGKSNIPTVEGDYYHEWAMRWYDNDEKRKQAIEYLNRCITIYIKYNDIAGLGVAYDALAAAQTWEYPEKDAQKYAEIQGYYQKSIAIHQRLGRLDQIAIGHNNIGNLYSEQYRDQEAIVEFKKALVYADSIKDWSLLTSIHENLMYMYSYTNEGEKALEHIEKYQAARDTLEKQQKQEVVLDLQEKYDTQEKERQITEQQRQLFMLLGALALFLLLMLGLIYFFLKLRKANQKNRKQAEELKALDKVKSKFFANISHELRTPLTLILGPLSHVLDDPDNWEKEEVRRQLLVMQRNGKNLMQLIEEILDLSKLEANKLEIKEESTPVKDFLEHVSSAFQPQFQSQKLNYELQLDLENKDLNVLLDRKKMEKVLNNFLSNAVKFTPKGGKITMKASTTNDLLKIKVSDTGKGVHPDDLPRIFDRFYQSGQADQKLYGGTGIGLALVSEFATLMGGRSYAESTLDKGSHFYFEIPKKEVAAMTALSQVSEEVWEEEQIDSIGTDYSILVVEDNNDMRDFVCQLLRKKYKEVIPASNGVEGLKILKERGTDGVQLVVSDIMMPEMDGFEMLREIKSSPEWNGIPVVMLTALADERDKLSALTIGVDDYLTKPFSVTELLLRVQNLLFNYHQRLAWKKENPPEEGTNVSEAATSTDAPKSAGLSAMDKEWLEGLETFVKERMIEETPNVDELAASAFVGKRQLTRKMKALTGLTPAKFIREVQLQSARKELEDGAVLSVIEVALNHGFVQQSTFSTLFKKRFGKPPSEYLKS